MTLVVLIIDLTDATYESPRSKMSILVKEEDAGEEAISYQKDNWILKKGLEGVNIQLPPHDWVISPPNLSRSEPRFEDANTPENWSSLSFISKFDKNVKYVHHALPIGIHLVNEIRMDGHYTIMDGIHLNPSRIDQVPNLQTYFQKKEKTDSVINF